MKSRTIPRVIRFVNFNKETNIENHNREMLLLFKPWRNESKDLIADCKSFSESFVIHKKLVLSNKSRYFNNSQNIEKILNELDRIETDLIPGTIAPNAMQTDMDDETEGQIESLEHLFFNPDRDIKQQTYDISNDIGIRSAIREDMPSQYMSDEEYFKNIADLNFKQREFFTHYSSLDSNKT